MQLSSKNTGSAFVGTLPNRQPLIGVRATYDLRDREIFGILFFLLLSNSSPWGSQGLFCRYGGVLLLVYRESYSPVDTAYATRVTPPNLSAASPRCHLRPLRPDRPFSQIKTANFSRRASEGRMFLLKLRLRLKKAQRRPSRASPRSVTRLLRTGSWVAPQVYSALWFSVD